MSDETATAGDNVDATQQNESVQGDTTQVSRPDWLPAKYNDEAAFDAGIANLADHEKVNMPWVKNAKFDSPEEKVAMYDHMASLIGKPKVPDNLQLSPEQTDNTPSPLTFDTLTQSVGVDRDALTKAVREDGKLPDEMYESFAKATIKMPDGTEQPLSSELVNAVIGAQAKEYAAQSQLQQIMRQRAADQVGGNEKLAALFKHGETLPKSMQESVNVLLRDPATMSEGLKQLERSFNEAVGAAGSKGIVSNGQAPTSSAPVGFKSKRELNEARMKYGANSEQFRSRLSQTSNDIIGGF